MKALIIGNAADIHVQAVASSLRRRGGDEPLLVDAPGLRAEGFTLTLDRFEHRGGTMAISSGGRGWLRRYAPSGWGTGTVSGSLAAAEKRAFLTLVGSISRLGNRTWLTPLDAMLGAEDRLVQLEVAGVLGISVPQTIVTSDPANASKALGERFVVKPLASGFYRRDDEAWAVYTNKLEADEAVSLDFGAAPFVAQEPIVADDHFRVVTVGTSAWAARLSAAGRPLDWRQQTSAHGEWEPVDAPDLCLDAVRLAQTLGVGYSSQDWIGNSNGNTFLDLNPGGQWMFLPSEICVAVTDAIADFLAEDIT
jgi:hypothetical protein